VTRGVFPDAPFLLAASSEMLFLELPRLERVKQIDAAGFLVEIWDWTCHDIDALASSGATFSSMTGHVRGRLADRDGAEELVATAKESIAVAARLGVPRLNLHGTGLGPDGLPLMPAAGMTGSMWLRARDTLRRLADLDERAGVTFVLGSTIRACRSGGQSTASSWSRQSIGPRSGSCSIFTTRRSAKAI
jgi:hydroxypyruvate isomerase